MISSRYLETCCFVGHGPDKLPLGADERRYRRRIGVLIDQRFVGWGIFSYITGLFPGVDLWCAEQIAGQISRQYGCFEGGITLRVVAGEGQEEEIERLKRVAVDAESVIVTPLRGVSDEQRQLFIIDQSVNMLVIHQRPLELPEVRYAKSRGIEPNMYVPAPIARRALSVE